MGGGFRFICLVGVVSLFCRVVVAVWLDIDFFVLVWRLVYCCGWGRFVINLGGFLGFCRGGSWEGVSCS